MKQFMMMMMMMKSPCSLAVTLWRVASRICSIKLIAFLSSSRLAFLIIIIIMIYQIKLYHVACKKLKRTVESDTKNTHVQPGYRNGIWHRKCAMLKMKWEKTNKGKEKTA